MPLKVTPRAAIDPRMMAAYTVRVYPIGRGASALNVVLLTRKNKPNTRLKDALLEVIQVASSTMPVNAH